MQTDSNPFKEQLGMPDQPKGDDAHMDGEAPEEAKVPDEVEVPEEEDRKPARRKFTCGVVYDTSQSITTLEDWLDENCKGYWSVSLEDVDDAMMKKSFKLLFELPQDKESFIRQFAKR